MKICKHRCSYSCCCLVVVVAVVDDDVAVNGVAGGNHRDFEF